MYFLVLGAHPKPDHDEYGTVDGAYVSAFAGAAASAAAAERAARDLIAKRGWYSDDLDEEPRWIERAELEGNAESLERFDQASADGVVASFHRWAVGAPNEE